MMNGKKRFVAIVLLLLCLANSSFAETVYDQPYLGDWPDIFRDRFSAEVWKQQAADNLAAVVQQSDLVILASAEELKEIKAPFDKDRIAFYEADVKLIEILKGEPDVTSFHLRFEPSATGVERGARHIFFLKKIGGTFKVLKASFVFPQGQGYDNHMRIVGYSDCSADVGIDTIKYLINRKVPADLDIRLMAEYMSESWMKMYSAVFMAASATPVVGMPVLKKAVSASDHKRFDLQLYGTAAYALARQSSRTGWQTLLENIPSGKGYGRIPESIAFDLAATYGDRKVVPVIKAVVTKKPDLAASAAFALSRIGGEEARVAVESWLEDEQLSKREALISNGWTRKKTSFAALFKQALAQMKSNNK